MWAEVLEAHPEHEGAMPWWCNVCGAQWTRQTEVAWDEVLDEYVCARHAQEDA